MRMSRPRFTVRRIMMVVGVSAVVFVIIRWIVTDVIQPKEFTYHGNTFISSRRLTSEDLEELGYPKPWYFIEPDPPDAK